MGKYFVSPVQSLIILQQLLKDTARIHMLCELNQLRIVSLFVVVIEKLRVQELEVFAILARYEQVAPETIEPKHSQSTPACQYSLG